MRTVLARAGILAAQLGLAGVLIGAALLFTSFSKLRGQPRVRFDMIRAALLFPARYPDAASQAIYLRLAGELKTVRI